MEAVGKKFSPLVEGSILRMEEYVKFLQGAEPAPSQDGVEWCSSFPAYPVDVILDISASEGLDVAAECCGTICVINTLPHMSLVSLLEAHSATSV